MTRLDETNCVPVMLKAFQRNPAVKALIFMPGATDEFYFFHRAQVHFTNSAPTLFDAVFALTNHTRICATFHPPFLLLHEVGGENGAGVSDPAFICGDDIGLTIEGDHFQLGFKHGDFAKELMSAVADCAAVPTVGHQGADGVGPGIDIGSHIVSLILEALAIIGPVRGKKMIANASAIDACLIKSQCGDVESGLSDLGIRRERLS